MFDSLYQSGNMMVNKLGQMARGLQSYHLAQQKPVEGVTHKGPEDMNNPEEWRLCEMDLITSTIEKLLVDVKRINEETPALDEKRKIATKSIIKRTPPPSPVIPINPLTMNSHSQHQRVGN